jgi:hypothetical protein
MAQAQTDPETQRLFRDEFSEPLRRETTRLIRAGVDQGGSRVDLNMARLIDAFVGAVYLRLLLGQSLNANCAYELGAGAGRHACQWLPATQLRS